MLAVQAWILAEKLLVPKLQNAIMSHLLKQATDLTAPLIPLTLIYKNTLPKSKMRAFALNTFARKMRSGDFEKDRIAFPEHFRIELSLYLLNWARGETNPDDQHCYMEV